MYNFSEKIVVITGAAQGLGAAMAKRFVEEGAKQVVLLDTNMEALKRTQLEIDSECNRTLILGCNVAELESVKKAFDEIEALYGRVDVLINNAGITRDAMVHKMTSEEFDVVVKVSLYGSFNCIQQVVQGMRNRGYGRIISIASLAAYGNFGQTNYSAAKAGIIGMTKTLSIELGPKNITVNCIAPGMINTDIIKTVPKDVLDNFISTIPLRRLGEAEEIACLVSFLASDEASYISGQCITISGGKN